MENGKHACEDCRLLKITMEIMKDQTATIKSFKKKIDELKKENSELKQYNLFNEN